MFKLLPFILLLTGCAGYKFTRPAASPSLLVSEGGAVSIAGDAKVAPKVDTSVTNSSIPIPEGSKIVFNEKLGTTEVVLSKPSQMAVKRTETALEGPVAFEPPKAPSAKEQADAKSEFWIKLGLYSGVFIGGAGAVFGLVRQWNLVMYGGLATLGASLFGLFVQRHPILLLIIGLGVALKSVGPILWHTKIKHLTNDSATN